MVVELEERRLLAGRHGAQGPQLHDRVPRARRQSAAAERQARDRRVVGLEARREAGRVRAVGDDVVVPAAGHGQRRVVVERDARERQGARGEGPRRREAVVAAEARQLQPAVAAGRRDDAPRVGHVRRHVAVRAARLFPVQRRDLAGRREARPVARGAREGTRRRRLGERRRRRLARPRPQRRRGRRRRARDLQNARLEVRRLRGRRRGRRGGGRRRRRRRGRRRRVVVIDGERRPRRAAARGRGLGRRRRRRVDQDRLVVVVALRRRRRRRLQQLAVAAHVGRVEELPRRLAELVDLQLQRRALALLGHLI